MSNQSEILKQRLFNSVARPWKDLLSEAKIDGLLADADVSYRKRLYTPIVTIWAMVYQVLCADKSLRNTVKWLRQWLVVDGAASSSDTGGYSKARSRLPEAILPRLVSDSGRALENEIAQEHLWCGRVVKVFDGSTVLMSDTPANQQAYPQHGNQQKGCGFPMARVVVFFSLVSGAVLCGSIASRQTSETEMSRALYSHLDPGDVAMADQLHGSYVDLALLQLHQADGMIRKHHARKTDFRTGKKTGLATIRWSGISRVDLPSI